MIYELIMSKSDAFYFYLACLTFVLMSVLVGVQAEMIKEIIQLEKDKTSLDKKLKSRFSSTL